MRLPEFDFVQPRSLEEACSIYSEHCKDAALLAGGTALMVGLRYRLSKPAVVIGLKGLPDLENLRENENGGISIGSMVTLEAIEQSAFLSVELPGLVESARVAAVPPVRQKATIGGNLCLDTRCIYYNQSEFWRSGLQPCFKRGGNTCHAVGNGRRCQAVYQGDLAPVLMALGAEVKIVSKNGQRIISLSELFTGRGEKPRSLEAGEMVTEVRIPASSRRSTVCYEKLRVREGMDFPMAGAAAMVKRDRTGRVQKARIVVGAVGPSPKEVPGAAKLLEGSVPTEDLLQSIAGEVVAGVQPAGNLAMDAQYRRKMIGVLLNRALRRALQMDAPQA